MNRIPRLAALIERSYLKLEASEVAPGQILAYKRNIFNNNLHLTIAHYSSGDAIVKMQEGYDRALALAQEVLPDDGIEPMPDYLKDLYVQTLWLLAIGIFLEVPDSSFAKAVAAWDSCRRKDWLVELLIGYRIAGRQAVDTLIFPKPYATLKRAVEEIHPHRRSATLKHYLEKEWYPGHKGCYWHDNHKSPHDVFFGYWSFEAAAVVKILGIDDSCFRDNPYYPKDMLG